MFNLSSHVLLIIGSRQWLGSVLFSMPHSMCLLSMPLSMRKSGSEFQVHNQDSLDTVGILKSSPPLLHPSALMWSYGLLLTMFVTVREELFGKYKAPDVTMFAAAYGGYIMVPLLVMLRVICTPVFSSSAKSERKPTKEIKTD